MVHDDHDNYGVQDAERQLFLNGLMQRLIESLPVAGVPADDWTPEEDADSLAQAEEWWEDEEEAVSALYHQRRKLSDYLLTARDLDKIPEATWLIEGVLPQDAIAAMYAAPGAGKTFVALDWAMSLAAGKEDWEGRALLPDAKVLYVYAEGAPGLRKRRDAWETYNEVQVDSGLWFVVRAADFLSTAGFEEEPEDDWSEMLSIVERLTPDLIVVDTMSRAIPGGDENDQSTMSRLMARVDELRERSGWATVLFIHHTNAAGTRERGSTVLRGAVNTLINIDAEDGILRVVKQRDDQEPTIGKVTLFPVEGTDSVVPTYEAVEDDGLDKDSIRRRVILETVQQTPGMTMSALHELIGGGKGKLLTMLSALSTEGFVEVRPEGRGKTIWPLSQVADSRSVQSTPVRVEGLD